MNSPASPHILVSPERRQQYCGIGIINTGDLQNLQGAFIDVYAENSPAARAGLRNGDLITHFRERGEQEWRPYSRSSTQEVRGAEGSVIELRGFHQNDRARPFHVSVTRRFIDTQPESSVPPLMDMGSCGFISRTLDNAASLADLGSLSPAPVSHVTDRGLQQPTYDRQARA
ncbi:MAG: PDZ domain-containing protein [Rickettsiales bacterium]|nr:PDZ domain-containing protein [Rickettsiales bacterium]